MLYRLSLTCSRSVVFSGYSSFLHKYNCQPRSGWNIVEVVLNTITLILYQCQLPLFSLLYSSECTTGRYGLNCTSHCDTCVNRICNRHDGHCTYGCIKGFKGDGCHLLGIHWYDLNVFNWSSAMMTVGKRLKISKETSEAVNWINTDNVMTTKEEDKQWSTKH